MTGAFAATYRPGRSAAFVVRPDGYLGYRGTASGGPVDVLAHLARTFRPPTM
jgi:hypothetical protein